MKNIIFFTLLIFPTLLFGQSSNCIGAEPFCTGTTVNFPASTNSTGNFPANVFFDCLGTQPNPAFYYLQIDQPGNLTITMQSTPLVDIDFICWGPFNDPNTMCDSLTAQYVEDCSYSTAAIESCDIINAVSGQFYILLITNYSNVNCNIDFSQTSGLGTTDCCILGDAGEDNINPGVSICNSDPVFNMLDELNGTPGLGGVWYDDNWNIVTNSFDPSIQNSGIYSYIVPGTPPPGTTITCPDDTSLLSISINPDPTINFPILNSLCLDDNPITLSQATPTGGTYSGNGVSSGVFTPSNSNLGTTNITYTYIDANGCSNSANQSITVNENPVFSFGADLQIACESTITLNPIINNGVPPYLYSWGDGSSNSFLITGGGNISLTVEDINGCESYDNIVISQDPTPDVIISGGGEICNNGEEALVSFNFNGLLPWNLNYSVNNENYYVNNITSNYYSVSTSNPGLYNVVLADDLNQCPANVIGENIEIILHELPTPIISPDFYELYPGDNITLACGNYVSYEWYSLDDTANFISTFENLYVDSTLSTFVIVEDENGCLGTSNIALISYMPRIDLYVPNAFTPNGDEHNDVFVTSAKNIQSFFITISNRWGEIVFTSNNINKHWDGRFQGKIVDQGTYSYNIRIVGDDKKLFVTNGTVNVLR